MSKPTRAIRDYLAKLGRKGGRASRGHLAHDKEHQRKAALARWHKARSTTKTTIRTAKTKP